MRGSACGTDGLGVEALLLLPPAAWDRLVHFFSYLELVGDWPEALTHWKVVFIPKEGVEQSGAPDADRVRPIAGTVLYRI